MSQAATEFETLMRQEWNTVLEDEGTGDWHAHWFLDGRNASISHSPSGMDFHAGPTFGNDADHAVLWTHEEFEGDMRIEYEFTRLDNAHRCVNILYLQATGSGDEPYATDITKWNHLREVPAMREYFGHMHTYHVSYAAFGNTDEVTPGYIRARRYMANELDGTEISPDYDPGDFFATGVPHRLTCIKSGDHIYFRVKNEQRELLCHWHNTEFPSIVRGRIGLRQMFTRASRYRDIRISLL